MRRRFAIGLLATLVLIAPAARSTDYRIADNRSYADFGVRLLWLHTISGRFMQIAGEVRVDSRDLATVDAHIDVNSIVMDSARSRRWVLAPEFFDAAQYPTLHFVSDPISLPMLTTGGVLDGRLTLRGVTAPIRFELMPTTCNTSAMAACVIEAQGTLSRAAFGMSAHRATLSDQVKLGLWITLGPATH
ncbi:MAG TPA: YceI family protein [Rhodanobacter sp.]